MTEEQRERWNKNRRERYANSPEVRERHRLAQEKWVAKKLKDNPDYLSDYMRNWRKKKQSLFQQITTSPEVLAPHLVYIIGCEEEPSLTVWASSIFQSVVFFTKAEAIAATVARLKEVEK